MGFKYRKKPVVIEAFEYSKGMYYVDIPEWATDAYKEGVLFEEDGELFTKTLEGPLKVDDGDFIIQGIKGELYPCKPDIFMMTYDPEDDTL